MVSCPDMDEVFEAYPTLLYSAKQDYGQARHDRPMHSHGSLCELLLCFQGFGTYNVDDRSYPIQRGDVIFGSAGELHEVVSDYDTEIGTYCFGIGDVHFRGLPRGRIIPEGASHVRASGPQFALFHSMCGQIDSLYAGGAQDRLTAQMLLISLILLAVRLPENNLALSGGGQLASLAKEYIDAHYTEPLTLELLARELGCSVPYLSHTFKDAVGYAPIQYMIRRRIGMAQTWLISSDLSATEIAAMVGYDNTNYFNTLFTRTVGLSPIRYRRQYLESLKGKRSQR